MENLSRRNLIVAFYCLALLLPQGFSVTESAAENNANGSQLAVIEPRYVCMVNNTIFPKAQIPVVVGDKTYYGCCEMCKDKLTLEEEARKAQDPVSGERVDKADAVIGATADGKVFYFESLENLQKYESDKKRGGQS